MTPVLGAVEDVVGAFGAFLIPVVLFVAGVLLYAVLYYLGRTDVAGLDEPMDAGDPEDTWDGGTAARERPRDRRDGTDAADEGTGVDPDATTDDAGGDDRR